MNDEHVSRTFGNKLIACRQVGHLVLLKTSMSKERSVLKMSALGLLAHYVRLLSFRTDFTIHEIAISIACTPAKCTFLAFRPLELKEVASVIDCVKCVPIPVVKQDDPPPWIAEILKQCSSNSAPEMYVTKETK